MKKIEDYLHYHLKCWGTIIESECENYGLGKWGLSAEILHQALIGNLKFTPHLRPLSDMTEEDLAEWDNEIKITHTTYAVEVDSLDEFGSFYEIYPDGSITEKSKDDGDSRPYNGGELIRVLLSKHFDLFGLIPAGIAIDKTTVQ